MIARFPSYYSRFRCIADKCRHSCCVGWEISLDEGTMEKYSALGRSDILSHINENEIILENGRCPFLCDSGLCRLISELGEEYTSRICREHPRFYHRVGDIIEGGIGLSCEEAARIVLGSDDYKEFINLPWQGDVADETDFDTLSHRRYIYSVLADEGLSYREKLDKIKEKYGLTEDIHTADEWREFFSSLEYLDEGHRGVFRLGEGREEQNKVYERFFAYLVFRHLTIAESYDNLRARLGFCLLLTRLLGGADGEDPVDFARIISEEIEYSENNTDDLIFEFDCFL